MKRTLFLIIILTFIAAGQISCGGEIEKIPQNTDLTSAGITEISESSRFVSDKLPGDLGFGGKSVRLFIGDYFNAFLPDMYSGELTGNRMDDALFNTIQSVQERLNVSLDYKWETYNSAEITSFNNKIIASILAGDNDYDIFFDVNNYASQMLDGKYFINLADTKYIDLESPWYNRTVIENMPDDYIYFLSGDFSLANIKSSFAM